MREPMLRTVSFQKEVLEVAEHISDTQIYIACNYTVVQKKRANFGGL